MDVVEDPEAPLLGGQSSAPSTSPDCPDDEGSKPEAVNQNQQRLVSLDVFRGLTVAVPPYVPLFQSYSLKFFVTEEQNWYTILILFALIQ